MMMINYSPNLIFQFIENRYSLKARGLLSFLRFDLRQSDTRCFGARAVAVANSHEELYLALLLKKSCWVFITIAEEFMFRFFHFCWRIHVFSPSCCFLDVIPYGILSHALVAFSMQAKNAEIVINCVTRVYDFLLNQHGKVLQNAVLDLFKVISLLLYSNSVLTVPKTSRCRPWLWPFDCHLWIL